MNHCFLPMLPHHFILGAVNPSEESEEERAAQSKVGQLALFEASRRVCFGMQSPRTPTKPDGAERGGVYILDVKLSAWPLRIYFPVRLGVQHKKSPSESLQPRNLIERPPSSLENYHRHPFTTSITNREHHQHRTEIPRPANSAHQSAPNLVHMLHVGVSP